MDWIETALLCERLHILPEGGGLFDQSRHTVKRLLLTYDQIDKMREIESKKGQH